MAGTNRPLITVVTPTILRRQIEDTIKSIDSQTYDNWEHVIIVDDAECKHDIKETERRRVVFAGQKYNNYGNTPKYLAWDHVKDGSYIMYMDDDDTYATEQAFELLASYLEANPTFNWAVFPGKRLGVEFFNIPPGAMRTMSNQFIHKKHDDSGDPIRWLKNPENDHFYHQDGLFVEYMIKNYPYLTIKSPPLVNVDYISRGKFEPGVYQSHE